MSAFPFHPELFDARSQLLAALAARGILWFSDYGTIDLLHDEYGVEVCGIREKETALQIGHVMLETFPDWPYGSLFLKEASAGEPGWKVIVAKGEDLEGSGFRKEDGSRGAWPLRQVLAWPYHDPSEMPDGESAWRPERPEHAPEGSRDGSPDDDAPAQGGAPEQGGKDSDDEAERAPDATTDDLPATFVRLVAAPGEPVDPDADTGRPGQRPAEVVDRETLRELVAGLQAHADEAGSWVGTVWIEFTHIGDEAIHPHREDHREVLERAIHLLAERLGERAAVGWWSETEAVVVLPAELHESAYDACVAVERPLNALRHARVHRGEHEVVGVRTRITLGFRPAAPQRGETA